ncbi:autotransporter-associated N-terminal domain-containing protein [Leptotrichia sp. oral taxon 223]|uniref:autotransporter-associated N-terminal domain-containing protein n=1 Tax=Leptotrichia sp. oral taxon 223 TaxID=712363 RepID=UPI0015B86BA4|nr:autotransporter-associated N-terminal domain-containing protein [Leptotrichia sp. oral taxon 223]NWO18662.1 autotransporter-associated N-terminal domain-containing protein [Leptotrichia sp. oral taxon 223]
MTNNLQNVKRDLCAFAKRCKEVHYTDSLLIKFLMTGLVTTVTSNLFSASANKGIESQKQAISTSIKTIHQQVKATRKENDKLLKNTNLELIQLMEQGDHVVKAPWSSWQYGLNYFNNNWNGTYKGRGDKKTKYPYEGVFQRSSNSFDRYTSPLSKHYGELPLGANRRSASSNERKNLPLSSYGLASNDPAQEPIVEMNVEASIRPKTVNIDIPDLGIRAPRLQALTVNGTEPPAITVPKPDTPTKEVHIVEPNANPFTGFFFNGTTSEIGTTTTTDPITGGTYYGGIQENSWHDTDGDGVNDAVTGAAATGQAGTATKTSNRPTNIFYRIGTSLSNVTFYVRGHMNSDTYTDQGSGASGGVDPTNGISGGPVVPTDGTIAIHTLKDMNVSNVTANLYGRAGFLTSETWRHGQVNMVSGNKINMFGTENSAFYIMPAAYRTITKYFDNDFHTGAIYGKTDINMYGKGNTAYLTTGISAPRIIANEGKIQSDGASNIVYSSFSYIPNWNKTDWKTYSGKSGKPYDSMNSLIKTSDVNLYGDENIVLFFGSKMKGTVPKSWERADAYPERNEYYAKGSSIGIYQGEIDVKANIGSQLTSDNKTAQTSDGQLGSTGYTSTTVDGAVGVFVESGQRKNIIPTKHLGVPVTVTKISNATGNPYGSTPATTINGGKLSSLDNDKIHNLEIGKIDIKFGKYSKDGFMIIAKKGSAVDIGKQTTHDYISTSDMSKSFSDGVNGASTSESDASKGTIVAYAEGVWKQTDHKLGSRTEGDNSTSALEDQPSEVNIYIPLTLASKEGIAYMGDNKGVVNAGETGKPITTTAVNHKSIIGFARDEGEVNIFGDITAADAMAATDKFENIAALATKTAAGSKGGTVTIKEGNIKISGMAGFASGTGSVVNIDNGTGNKIQTGKNGALVATDGGTVNFSGGAIYHENKATSSNVVAGGTDTVDHSKSTPFYADTNASAINFKGATTINMSDGILMPGTTAADYEGNTAVATAKYHGMQNVTVNLTGDNVVLRTYTGDTTNWTGGTTGSNNIKNDMQLAALNTNNKKYKIYYIDGIFNLNNNQNLDDPTDEFNTKVGLSNEKFTIASGVTVSSATGKGLSMASHDGVTTNTTTGYTNNGTINITGGTPSNTTALSTSFGYVDNKGTINVDNGIGAYGINGSSLTNNSAINITSSGVGMAGFASASTLKTYGTDDKISKGTLTAADKVLEVTNNGTITVAGNGSIGLYGNTNDVAGTGLVSTSNGVITNNGKIVMTGDSGVGIVSEGKGNTINLGGTGSSDIAVGTNGIGVYASGTKSVVNFTSDTGVEIKDKGVGISVSNGSIVNPNGKTFEIKYTGSANASGAGIFYDNTATNVTDINIVNTSSDKGIVGVYATKGTLTNTAAITDKSGKAYGIYSEGANVINSGTLTIGNKGKGILSTNGDVTLTSSSVINLGEDEAIGVYTKGTGNNVTADAGSTMAIGNGSYGFINEGTGNTITSNMTSQTVGDNTVFVFSRDTSGTVINNTPLTSTGSLNYGLYSAGNVVNNADINYGSGIGNVGVYSTNGGNAVNNKTITVGASNPDPTANQYAIGMAAGYFGDASTPAYTGNVVNKGTINVNGEYGIGMYGTEIGTTVTNDGTINLNASNTTGMYLDNGAYGINNGVIKSNGAGLKKVVGMVVKNGSTIENNGTIEINAEEAVGLLAKGNAAGHNIGKIKNYGTLRITGSGAQDSQVPEEGQEISKDMSGVKIHAPAGSSTATITVNGVPVVPELATTTAEEYKPMEVSTIGMYIDTSNRRFTTPVTGLSKLSTLTNADLIIGAEAAQNTTGKYIQVSQKILEPYNKMILNNPQINKWNIYSGSLTWMASVAQNQTDGTIQNAYLAKIPYTRWAGRKDSPVNSTDTYNFLDGLEQRYGVEGLGTREKLLFDKISGIGNNEEILFYQATDEIMGHQYGNLQQRINATGNILDKEFRYLKHDWRNPSKQNNKIKVFGARDEYNTDTAGIIDYTSNAYGVAYVHEDEKIKMGNSSGWYAGAVTNRFKFKDIGHSRENQTQLKAGIFKTMSPKKDYNGALQWTIGGDVFVGINDMKRRYLVVDDVFQAKSDYHSYGAALKTDLGYDIRMSERTHLRPYGALKMEYGRFNDIKEDRGEMRLEVKGNDYFSVKPEVGMEFRYVQPLAVRTNLTVGLSAAYENELGKMASKNNEGRVRYTSADWFGIRGEKEDRRGNGKFDLNIGVDNTRFGVTVNGGYDTKGNNVRAGIGFRAIY